MPTDMEDQALNIRPLSAPDAGAFRQISQVLSFARDEGVLQIQLCVNAENVRARNLYLALGFKPFGLEPRAMRVGSQYFDEEHMVLRLDD
jgi:RimJ/RimL family protein N-acetyltransferase